VYLLGPMVPFIMVTGKMTRGEFVIDTSKDLMRPNTNKNSVRVFTSVYLCFRTGMGEAFCCSRQALSMMAFGPAIIWYEIANFGEWC